MNNIENRIVEMKFDNAQFESAVAKTMETLDRFKEKLNFEGAGKGMDQLGKATGNYQYTLNDIGQSLDQLNGKFSTMGNIGRRVLENLTDSAYGFIQKGIGGMLGGITQGGLSRAMNLEQAKFQMQGIYKDAQKVYDVIYNDILPELMGTPFSLDQAAVVIGQLGASGIQASEDIHQATRAIAGLAAMSGRGFDEVGRIFSKIAGQGNMMGGELQQLSTYGINAAANLSDYFTRVAEGSQGASDNIKQHVADIIEAYGDLSEGTIRDAASKRMIFYEDVAAAMDTLYGEHAKKSTEMYTGALEDLKAALARIGAEPAAIGLEVLRNAFNALVPAVDAVNAVLKPFTNAGKDVVDTVEGKVFGGQMYGKLAKEVQSLGISFANLFVRMDENGKVTRWTTDSVNKYRESIAKAADTSEAWQKDYSYYIASGDAIMNPQMWRILTNSTQSFVNVMKAFRNVLQPIAQGMFAAFPKVTLETIANITEKVRDFTKALIFSEDNMARIKDISQAVFTPLGLVLKAIGIGIRLVVEVVRNLFNTFKPALTAFLSFAAVIGRLVVDIAEFITKIAEAGFSIGRFAFNISDSIIELFRFDKFVELIQKGFYKLADILDKIGLRKIKDLVDQMGGLGNALKAFGGLIIQTLHLDTAFQWLSVLGANLKAIVIDVLHLNQVGSAFQNFVNAVKDLASTDGLLGKLLTNLKNFIDWIAKLVPYEKIVTSISNAFERLGEKVKGITQGPANKISTFFNKIASEIADFIKNLDEGNAFQVLAKSMIKPYAKFKTMMTNLQKILIPFIKNLVSYIPQLFGFINFGEMMVTIGNKIKIAVKEFAKFIGILGDLTKTQSDKKINQLRKTLTTFFGTTLADNIIKMNKALSNAGSGFAEKLVVLGKSVGEALQHMDAEMIKKFISTIVLLAMAWKSMGVLRGTKSALDGYAAAFRGLGKLFNSFNSAFGFKDINLAIAKSIRLISLGAALMLFAGSVYILSKMDWKQVLLGTVTMLATLLVFYRIMRAIDLMGKTVKGATGVQSMAIYMAAIGAGILLMATAVKQISDVWDRNDPGKLISAVISVIAIMIAFMGVAKVLGGIDGKAASLGKASFALIGISQGLKVMAEAFEMFGKLDEAAFTRGLEAAIAILLMFSLFAVSVRAGANVFGAAVGMIAIAGAMMLMYKAMSSFAEIKPAKMEQAGLAMGQILIALMGFALVAGLAQKSILAASIGMLAIGASILVIAKAMEFVGGLDQGVFERGSAAIVAILAAFVLFARFAGGVKTAGSALGILMLAAGVRLLTGALNELSEIKFGGILVALRNMILIAAGVAVSLALLKGSIESLDSEDAINLGLVGGGLFLLAKAVGTLAAIPIAALAISIIGLAAAIFAIGLAMNVFTAVAPGMLLVAGAFALMGVAALFVGAGLLFLTLALTSLIPLLLTISMVDKDTLAKGLDVLRIVAQGLAGAIDILTASIFAFGGSLLVAGLGLIAMGIGFAAVGAGCTIAALGVSLFAGSLALLAVTIAHFFGGEFLTIIGGFIDSIKEKFTGLFDHIRQNADAGTTDLKQKLIEANDAGDQYKGDEIKDKITEPVKSAPTEIAGQSGSFFSAFASLPQAGAEGYNSTSPLLSESIDGMQSDLLAQLEAGNAAQGDLGSQGSLDFLTGYASNSSSASGYANKMVNSLVSAEQKGDHRGAGRKDITQFVGGMKSVDVKGTANQVGSDAVPPDKSDEAYDVGYNITMGLADGIGDTRAVQAVCNAAADAVKQAIAEAKAEAAESSPSKKTMEIGWFMSKGLAIGITKGVKEVEYASKDVVAEGINAITSAMDKASSLFDANVDYTPTITPVVDLSNVAYSAAGINSMFGHTGITLDANLNAISSSIESANQNDLNLLAAIDVMSSKIEELESRLMAVQPDYGRISAAVEHGASRATLGGVSLNGRELKRGLKDMGVVTR